MLKKYHDAAGNHTKKPITHDDTLISMYRFATLIDFSKGFLSKIPRFELLKEFLLADEMQLGCKIYSQWFSTTSVQKPRRNVHLEASLEQLLGSSHNDLFRYGVGDTYMHIHAHVRGKRNRATRKSSVRRHSSTSRPNMVEQKLEGPPNGLFDFFESIYVAGSSWRN